MFGVRKTVAATRLFPVILLAIAALNPDILFAGANAGATARLTWDRASVISNLSAVPGEAFPLFLTIQGASDVRSLAVHLQWTPADTAGGYAVLPAGVDASCGWAKALPPGGDFEGDSSYTWSITFPPGSADRSCVIYSIAPVVGGPPGPANFCLVSVKVKDSAGSVDTLAVLGDATILSGAVSGCPVVVESVSPHILPAGQEATLIVKGTNFAPGASVRLRADGLFLNASSVQVSGPRELSAVVTVPDSVDAPFDVLVSLADGRSAELEDAVAAKQLWWGFWIDSTITISGKMGSGVPLFRDEMPSHSARAAKIVRSQVTLSAPCHSVPFCTVPFGGNGVFGPSISGPMPSNCRKQATFNSATSITYFLCYSGPCTPSSPNKVVNLPVALEVYPRQITGGHCHADNSRPTKSPPRGLPVSGNTGTSGLGFSVDHIWPDPGGAVNAVFYSTGQDTFVFNAQKDTTYIYCVLVDNLELLTDGPAYSRVGATSIHPEAWYGLPDMNQALRQLAVTIADSLPGLPPMGYNDMSLVWGGILDLPGNWGMPHCSHRLGRSCDLQTRTLMSDPLVDNAFTRKLRRLILMQGFREPFKHSNHWHLNWNSPTGP